MPSTDSEMRRILTEARTIAVVGLSDHPDRDSNSIARFLKEQGYRIIPVNPALPQVLGERSFPSLSAIPREIEVDIADVFRRSEHVGPIVEEAVERDIPVVWLQLGVANPEAAERGRAAGLTVLEDTCIRVQHRRLQVPPVVGAA